MKNKTPQDLCQGSFYMFLHMRRLINSTYTMFNSIECMFSRLLKGMDVPNYWRHQFLPHRGSVVWKCVTRDFIVMYWENGTEKMDIPWYNLARQSSIYLRQTSSVNKISRHNITGFQVACGKHYLHRCRNLLVFHLRSPSGRCVYSIAAFYPTYNPMYISASEY